MNYGKLTAGTTKTAIDTAKPSEKGEIITYLSRMGDVLDDVPKWRKIVIITRTIHTVIDSDETDILIGEHDLRVHSDFQIVSTEAGHIFDDHAVNISRFNISQHLLKTGAVETRTTVTIVYIELVIGDAVVFRIFL